MRIETPVTWTPVILHERFDQRVVKGGLEAAFFGPVKPIRIEIGDFVNVFWMYSKRSSLKIDPVKDFDLFAEKVYDAKKTGAIILGGGTAKHHTLYMNTLREGLDAAVQISSARADDGNLSGAPLRETVNWGKVKGEKTSTIFGDVTSVFPLIVAAALEKVEG